MRFPPATLRSEGSLPALQSLSLLQQSSEHRLAAHSAIGFTPRLFSASTGQPRSDANRGALGNVEDVLVTLPCGRVQGIPVDFMDRLRGLEFALKLPTEQ